MISFFIWFYFNYLSTFLVKVSFICFSNSLLLFIIFRSVLRFLVSNFLFDAEYSSFRLLKNKAVDSTNVAKPFVIPELKQYDYLLKIDTELSVEEINVYLSQIKLMQQVQLVELVNVEKLSSKENLLF